MKHNLILLTALLLAPQFSRRVLALAEVVIDMIAAVIQDVAHTTKVTRMRVQWLAFLMFVVFVGHSLAAEPKTRVSIVGDAFQINGRPTYAGRTWNGRKIEGLLLNSRMVQATFDDRNPETVSRWAYPDTQKWDADRSTNEFIEMMPS